VASVTGITSSVEESSLLTITHGEIAQLPVSYVDIFTTWFNARAHYFILLWMIFVAVNCLKVFAGLAALNRLRNYKTHPVPVEWKTKLDSLRKSIGLNQSVVFLQSELTKVPVAVGFFKPAIFVPLGLITHLPAEQVETILLHELAHIRRRDYMVNLLQRFAEAIFFFNPGLIWISSLIRQEREACCDDIVVANTSHQRSYLEALVSFQEYALTAPAYAMGIGSKKNYLFNRVKRLLTRENKKLDIMEKLVLIAGIVVLTAFTFIPQEKEKKEITNKQSNSVVAVRQKTITSPELPTQAMWEKAARPNKKRIKKPVVIPAAIIDSPPAKIDYDQLQFPGINNNINDDGKTRTQTTVATDQNGKKYTITKLNGKVTSLTIDGNNIPEKEFDNYNSLVQRVDATTHGNKVRSQKEMEERRGQMERKIKEREKRLEESKKERERDLKDRERKTRDKVEEAKKERNEEMEDQRKERARAIKEKVRDRMDEQKDKTRDRERKQKDGAKEREQEQERKVKEREKKEIKEKSIKGKQDFKRDKKSRADIQEKPEIKQELHLESKLEFKPGSISILDKKSELHLREEYIVAKKPEPAVPTMKAEPNAPKSPSFKPQPSQEPSTPKKKLFTQPRVKLFS
ncbi:MAG: M56 family metallopeptidase, partial [Chitinophagaceae bacterium]